MAEESVPVPAEVEKMEETTEPSTSEQVEGTDVDTEAKKLMGVGSRNMVMKDIRAAVNAFQEASSLLGKKYGETADQCADAFFYYGMALLELARMENGVLGNALEGMPEDEEEDGEKTEDSNIPSAANLDEQERETLREQVYDAMAEQEKQEKSDAEAPQTNGKENGDVQMEEEDKPSENKASEKTNEDTPVSNEKADEAEKSTAATDEKAADVTEKAAAEPVTEKAADVTEKAAAEPVTEKAADVTEKAADVTEKAADVTEKAAAESVTEEKAAEVSKSEETETKEKMEEAEASEKKEDSSEPPAKEGSKTADVSEPSVKESEESKPVAEEKEGEKPPAVEETKEQPDEKEEKTEEEDEPMEGEEEEGAESEDGDDENEATEEKGDDEDEVGNLQLAWEMLDLSKVIYKRQQNKEAQLKAAQAHLKLGEVSIESENYGQAIEDFIACLNIQKEHLEEHDRLLAETHYQLGLAYQYSSKHDSGISHFTQSTEVIEKRVAVLTEQLKAAGESTEELQKEMDELKGLLPDIREKIEDSKEALKTAETTEKALQETLVGGSSGFSQENGSTSASAAPEKSADSTVTVTNCVSDISHLVRKKRKPEEESPLKEAKKPKADPVENGSGNGDAVVPTNEAAEKAEEAETQTPMETTAVGTTA